MMVCLSLFTNYFNFIQQTSIIIILLKIAQMEKVPEKIKYLKESAQSFQDSFTLSGRLGRKLQKDKRQKQHAKAFFDQFQQNKSGELSYDDLKQGASKTYASRLKQISSKLGLNGLEEWPQFRLPARTSNSKYKALKNSGEEVVAEILLELGLIEDISSYSLNELLREAMGNHTRQSGIFPAGRFIEGIQEFHHKMQSQQPSEQIEEGKESQMLEYSSSEQEESRSYQKFEGKDVQKSEKKLNKDSAKQTEQNENPSIKFSFINSSTIPRQGYKIDEQIKSKEVEVQNSSYHSLKKEAQLSLSKLLLYQQKAQLKSVNQCSISIFKKEDRRVEQICFANIKDLILTKRRPNFKLISHSGICYRIKFQHKEDFQQICKKLKQTRNKYQQQNTKIFGGKVLECIVNK